MLLLLFADLRRIAPTDTHRDAVEVARRFHAGEATDAERIAALRAVTPAQFGLRELSRDKAAGAACVAALGLDPAEVERLAYRHLGAYNAL